MDPKLPHSQQNGTVYIQDIMQLQRENRKKKETKQKRKNNTSLA